MENENLTKYQLIEDYIIQYIKDGNLKYNDKIFSEPEIMNKFNVSRHTVRKAIENLVNKGWLYKKQGKGTFVDDPMVTSNSNGKLVGVVATYIKDYIFGDIISGIEKVLTKNGYNMILGNTNNDRDKERLILTNMLNSNLSGLIIEPTKSVYPNHNKDLYDQFDARGIPVVYIHATYPNIEASYVVENDEKAGYMATEHLISLGHKRIGAIFKSDDIQGHGRFLGYSKCLRDNDIEFNQQNVVWFSTEDISSFFNQENANKLVRRLGGFSAVVCYNDQVAIKLFEVFKQHQIRIPEDLSLVSFDNSKIAQNSEVKLTTVAHPKSRLGNKAANGLLELITDKNKVIHEVMDPELIIRESTSKINDY